MSLAARILGGVALLLLSLLLVGMLVPGRWEVEEHTTVAVTPDSVYDVVGRISAWSEWMPWPEESGAYAGPSFGPGASFHWDDPTYGTGRFTIVEALPPRSVTYRVEVEDGSIVTRGRIDLERIPDGGTTIRWLEEGAVGWNPLLGFVSLTLEDRQGAQLRAALEGLESHLESEATTSR